MSNMPSFPLPFPGDRTTAHESEFVGCEAAEEFYHWASPRIAELDDEDLVSINQKIILVTSKYHDWYKRVPEKHRVRVGRRGHQCIFHVFMSALDKLMEAKTKLDPPMYFPIPAPSSPPPEMSEDPTTFLGLLVESDEEEA